MKRVVTGGDLSQIDMRPPDLLDRYVGLVAEDIRELGASAARVGRVCPACGGDGVDAFTRLDFSYRRCSPCGSLFVSPPPDAEWLQRYRSGRAERFRRETWLPATAEVRSKHARTPRVRWVASTAASRLGSHLSALDVSGRDPELPDALLATVAFQEVQVQPLALQADLSGPAEAGPHVKRDRDEPIGEIDAILAFDELERVLDLTAAVARCRRQLRRGGLLFATTISGTGFEISLLGGQMRSLVPPIHLQLLSKAGWTSALQRAGFRLIEYSTPGALDVQAVADACRRNPNLRLPTMIDELVRHDDEQVGHAFQEVLQQAGLSSHVQFVAEALETA